MKIFFLTLFFIIPSARGEGGVRAFAKHLVGNTYAGFYDTNQDKWRWQSPTIVATTAATSYLFYQINDQPMGKSGTDNKLGEGSVWISRVGTYFPLVLPTGFFLSGLFLKKGSVEREHVLSVAEEMVEAIIFTYGATGALKLIFNRTRPDGTSNYSFPSGHTAPNFAAAGILAYRYPWYIGAPALALVSAIGLSRIDLNQHFASDVVAGAGLGLFFATSVYLNHLDMRAIANRPKASLFSPLMINNTYGMIWTKVM